MNVPERIAQLSQALPPEKQAEVLDFVEFRDCRQPYLIWRSSSARRLSGARTLGMLRHTRTGSQVFTQRQEHPPTKTRQGIPCPSHCLDVALSTSA